MRDDEPRPAVDDCLIGAAASPGYLRHPRCSRLQEDDPESLLLEAEPAIATTHRPDVSCAVEKGHVVVGDPPQETHLRARPPRHSLQPATVPTCTTDGQRHVGTAGAQPSDRFDEHVHALPRHKPADAHDEAAVSGKP